MCLSMDTFSPKQSQNVARERRTKMRAPRRQRCLWAISVAVSAQGGNAQALLPSWGVSNSHKTGDPWLEAHPATIMALRIENEALQQKTQRLESQLMATRWPSQTSRWPHATSQNASTEFSKERLEELAGGPGQGIILTFVNSARLDFARSWVAHLRRLGLRNWLVGATDPETLRVLLREGIPCFDMHTNLPSQTEWAWGAQPASPCSRSNRARGPQPCAHGMAGSASFHSLGPHKIELIYHTLQWGLELVITDVDAMVLREPFAYMVRRSSRALPDAWWPAHACTHDGAPWRRRRHAGRMQAF